jgi:hypothetical protein
MFLGSINDRKRQQLLEKRAFNLLSRKETSAKLEELVTELKT